MRTQKHWISRLLLFAAFFLSLPSIGCNGEITFDVPASGSSLIPKGSLLEEFISDFGFGSFLNMDISTSQEFKNNNVERARVTRVVLTRLTLTVESPSDQNLDFLTKVTFFVQSDGLSKQAVASADIPKGSRNVTLTPTNADIGAYVRAAKFSITTEVNGRRPTKDTTVRADATFQVSARIL